MVVPKIAVALFSPLTIAVYHSALRQIVLKGTLPLACSRRSDSGARAKTKASERAGKKTRGDSFFPALSLALVFARAPLSERLEQATLPQIITSAL